MRFLYLFIAILLEVMATSALKASEQFTKPLPSILVVLGYGAAFYFLSLCLKTIPMGVAYAIWSGVGIVLVTLAGMVLYKQTPDVPALIGIALILLGVIILNVFSKMEGH